MIRLCHFLFFFTVSITRFISLIIFAMHILFIHIHLINTQITNICYLFLMGILSNFNYDLVHIKIFSTPLTSCAFNNDETR